MWGQNGSLTAWCWQFCWLSDIMHSAGSVSLHLGGHLLQPKADTKCSIIKQLLGFFCTGVRDGINDNRAIVGLITVPIISDSPTDQMASWLVSSKSLFFKKRVLINEFPYFNQTLHVQNTKKSKSLLNHYCFCLFKKSSSVGFSHM